MISQKHNTDRTPLTASWDHVRTWVVCATIVIFYFFLPLCDVLRVFFPECGVKSLKFILVAQTLLQSFQFTTQEKITWEMDGK